jgi:hypothetical protein
MSDGELDVHFQQAIDPWKQSPEAMLLLQLRAEHRQACRHAKACAAEVDVLEHGRRPAAAGLTGPIDRQLSQARREHERAVQAEQLFWGCPVLADATRDARQSLIGHLQAVAIKLLTKIGEPDGPPWEVIHKLIPEELAKRADALLASLQAEIETPYPEVGP